MGLFGSIGSLLGLGGGGSSAVQTSSSETSTAVQDLSSSTGATYAPTSVQGNLEAPVTYNAGGDVVNNPFSADVAASVSQALNVAGGSIDKAAGIVQRGLELQAAALEKAQQQAQTTASRQFESVSSMAAQAASAAAGTVDQGAANMRKVLLAGVAILGVVLIVVYGGKGKKKD